MAPQRTTFPTKEFYATQVSFCRVVCPGQPFHPWRNLNCEFTANGLKMPWPDKFQICHFSQERPNWKKALTFETATLLWAMEGY